MITQAFVERVLLAEMLTAFGGFGAFLAYKYFF